LAQIKVLQFNNYSFSTLCDDPASEPFIALHLRGHSLAAHGNGGATYVADVLTQRFTG
jgi:hypothetical protein